MIAIRVEPGSPAQGRLAELDEPATSEHELLVEMVALGICGTDREIVGLDHPNEQIGPRARERVREEFTSPRSQLDYLAVIKNLLARPAVRAAA